MGTTYTIRQKNKHKGIFTWYLRTCVNGREAFESLHTTKKYEALAALEAIKKKQIAPEIPTIIAKTIAEDAVDWLRQCSIEFGDGSRTVMAYSSRINAWVKWCNANNITSHTDFNAQYAFGFVQWLTETKAPKTITEIVKVVSKCLAWNSETYGIEDLNPFKGLKLPRVRSSRVEFWTASELDKIIDNAPSQSYKTLWGLMAYAGLRWSEARNLRKEHIKDGFIAVINGKGGKDAEIPISSRLMQLITPMMDGTDGLLIQRANVPLRSDKAIIALKVAVSIAGIQGSISHHKLRHSFASELLRNGVNPEAVKELMRHSSIDTLFRHYAHVLRDDLKLAVEKI